MNKELRKVLLAVFTFLAAIPLSYIAFIVFIVGPVDNAKTNCLQVKGIVETIEEGSSYDILFKLKGNSHRYYINRGLENGLELSTLQQALANKEIELWHANSYPLRGGHIAQLQIGSQIYYSEWEQ